MNQVAEGERSTTGSQPVHRSEERPVDQFNPTFENLNVPKEVNPSWPPASAKRLRKTELQRKRRAETRKSGRKEEGEVGKDQPAHAGGHTQGAVAVDPRITAQKIRQRKTDLQRKRRLEGRASGGQPERCSQPGRPGSPPGTGTPRPVEPSTESPTDGRPRATLPARASGAKAAAAERRRRESELQRARWSYERARVAAPTAELVSRPRVESKGFFRQFTRSFSRRPEKQQPTRPTPAGGEDEDGDGCPTEASVAVDRPGTSKHPAV